MVEKIPFQTQCSKIKHMLLKLMPSIKLRKVKGHVHTADSVVNSAFSNHVLYTHNSQIHGSDNRILKLNSCTLEKCK